MVNNNGILVFGIFWFLVFLDISTIKKGEISKHDEKYLSYLTFFQAALYHNPQTVHLGDTWGVNWNPVGFPEMAKG